MTELVYIIAVALWCQPEPTAEKEQICRAELIECTKKNEGRECFVAREITQ